MIDYLAEDGIDVTSEFTYRENPFTQIAYGVIGRTKLCENYPMNMLGKIPASWWVDKIKPNEIMEYYPHTYCGQLTNKKYANALYYNIHCEEIWKDCPDVEKWAAEFEKQFALINVPFFYLGTKTKKNYKESKKGVVVEFSDKIVSDGVKKQICKDGKIIKDKDFVCLPIFWRENGYVAYSEKSQLATLFITGETAKVYEITHNGIEFISENPIVDGKIELFTENGKLYFIEA